jgi:hypothetical protein
MVTVAVTHVFFRCMKPAGRSSMRRHPAGRGSAPSSRFGCSRNLANKSEPGSFVTVEAVRFRNLAPRREVPQPTKHSARAPLRALEPRFGAPEGRRPCAGWSIEGCSVPAVSYRPLAHIGGGQRFKRSELIEISVVSAPADVNATVVARSFAAGRVDVRKMGIQCRAQREGQARPPASRGCAKACGKCRYGKRRHGKGKGGAARVVSRGGRAARAGAAATPDLSQRGEGEVRRCNRGRDRLCRATGVVLVQPFLRQRRRHGDGRRLRARGDPTPRPRPLRRHAAGRRRPSGDAALSEQRAVDRPRFGRRHQPGQGSQRKPGA